MLFDLLLASITILLCFFSLFLVAFNSFFTIPIGIENTRLQLALIIPTGASIAVANDAIEMMPVVTDETINYSSKWSKEVIYLLSFLLISSFSLIPATK